MKKKRTGKRARKCRNGDSNLHKFKRYGGKPNQHHDLAQEFGGKNDRANIYEWDINVHHAIHFLFGNRTLLEAASLLIYIDTMKKKNIEVDVLGVEE